MYVSERTVETHVSSLLRKLGADNRRELGRLAGHTGATSMIDRGPIGPSGTVTFLFTDVEDSTALWELHPSSMPEALAHHDGLLREAIGRHRGHIFTAAGDGFGAAFASAPAGCLGCDRCPALTGVGVVAGRCRCSRANGTAQRCSDGERRQLLRWCRQPCRPRRRDRPRQSHPVVGAHGQPRRRRGVDDRRPRPAPPERTRAAGANRSPGRPGYRSSRSACAPAVVAGNLPHPSTALIGRRDELSELVDMLGTHRLVTVTGTGGAARHASPSPQQTPLPTSSPTARGSWSSVSSTMRAMCRPRWPRRWPSIPPQAPAVPQRRSLRWQINTPCCCSTTASTSSMASSSSSARSNHTAIGSPSWRRAVRRSGSATRFGST